ncbi:hypothetical protein ACWD26_20025 [Streptomyces sp. NPDC002787]
MSAKVITFAVVNASMMAWVRAAVRSWTEPGRAADAGAVDVDLAAPYSVPQRDQNAQLIGDALELALVVNDRLAPVLAHHAVHGHCVASVVEAGPAVDVGVFLQ